MSFDFDAWLTTQKTRVESLLDQRLNRVATHAPARLVEAMRYSLMAGGKRLRPILVLAFADAASKATRGGGEPADDAAVAVEMIHTYSLIHDDLPAMDDDDLRRGRPTNHKVYGEAMAILAGDALLTDALASVSGGPGGSPEVRAALTYELAHAAGARGMVGGQVLDIAEDRPAELDYLVRLHRMKTGALLKAACRMGAIAGGASAEQLAAADRFGDSIGLAFQIADDVLDVTASAEAMGKPTGADADAGRHTFPAVVGLERSRALAKEHAQAAVNAAKAFEAAPGALAALAVYSVERSN